MIANEKQKDAIDSRFSVAENACYDLLYDLTKNRIYFKIKGFWKNREAVPNFLPDWKKIISLAMPGFTVLADLSAMLTQPQDMNSLHLEAQQMMVKAGVLQIAQINPLDKIATLQVDQVYTQSALPLIKFCSVQDAEQGLDKASSVNQQ